MPARLSGRRPAGTRRQRGPSVAVRGKPSGYADRPAGTNPSAMRPWTPQHNGLQRYKVTHAGTLDSEAVRATDEGEAGRGRGRKIYGCAVKQTGTCGCLTPCPGWRRAGPERLAFPGPPRPWVRVDELTSRVAGAGGSGEAPEGAGPGRLRTRPAGSRIRRRGIRR